MLVCGLKLEQSARSGRTIYNSIDRVRPSLFTEQFQVIMVDAKESAKRFPLPPLICAIHRTGASSLAVIKSSIQNPLKSDIEINHYLNI